MIWSWFRHELVMFQAWFGHVSAVFRSCWWHDSVMSETWLIYVLGRVWPSFRHELSMFNTWFGDVSTVISICSTHLLVMFETWFDDHVSDMCWSCVQTCRSCCKRYLHTFHTWLGHVLSMWWQCLGNMLATFWHCWQWIGHSLARSGHILGII